MSVPTPGTDERAEYERGRGHIAERPPYLAPEIAALSWLRATAKYGASDACLAAAVRGVLAGVDEALAAAVLTHAEGPDSPVTLRRNPDCAAGKHASCSGDAWDARPAYDERCACECICHDATDCQCGQDGCPNAAAVAQAAAEATYLDVLDVDHTHDTPAALAGVDHVEVVGLVADRDGRPHLLIDTSP